MGAFVDLTQTFRDGMPGFRMKDAAGEMTEFTAHIRPFLTHAQSRPYYDDKASFEITEVSFQTSLGTYLDAPCHRHPGRGDIASLPLEGLILDGVVVDGRHATPERPLAAADLPEAAALAGKAVLIHFGWDRHWGSEAYYAFPHVDRSGLQHLQAAGIALFGVDALNADCPRDLERPAHTWFLDAGIHIVENLCGLGPLLGRPFRFFAIPLKVQGAAAFPIRAFAEVA
ncbi:MAG: cyclase family protein [Rhodospirillaceae bacterium]|nr:cyclase family protein [Rhodospirillaceae bacterium]